MTRSDVSTMAAAAEKFLSSLSADQAGAARTTMDAPDYRVWTYLPGPRPGLSMVEMTADQQGLALELLDTGCSASGGQTARGVIALDRIRREIATGSTDLDGDRFWVRVLGDPSGDQPWAWRVNGHHLAVHVTVVSDAITVTPNFFGAEPAVVLSGPHEGLRTLVDEEELARELLALLSPEQRADAITSDTAPNDIQTRFDPVADPGRLPRGLGYAGMTPDQQALLRQLIRVYVDRAPAEHAEACWREVVDAGLDQVWFSWAGSDRRGQGHYYCVGGPTFLIEYDNTQDDANHIHSVWRDLQHDWGEDLLAAHYAQHRHGG